MEEEEAKLMQNIMTGDTAGDIEYKEEGDIDMPSGKITHIICINSVWDWIGRVLFL